MSPDDRQKPFHPRQTVWARSGGSQTAPLVRTLSTTLLLSGMMTEGAYVITSTTFIPKTSTSKKRS
jgi:hypothetical protein